MRQGFIPYACHSYIRREVCVQTQTHTSLPSPLSFWGLAKGTRGVVASCEMETSRKPGCDHECIVVQLGPKLFCG